MIRTYVGEVQKRRGNSTSNQPAPRSRAQQIINWMLNRSNDYNQKTSRRVRLIERDRASERLGSKKDKKNQIEMTTIEVATLPNQKAAGNQVQIDMGEIKKCLEEFCNNYKLNDEAAEALAYLVADSLCTDVRLTQDGKTIQPPLLNKISLMQPLSIKDRNRYKAILKNTQKGNKKNAKKILHYAKHMLLSDIKRPDETFTINKTQYKQSFGSIRNDVFQDGATLTSEIIKIDKEFEKIKDNNTNLGAISDNKNDLIVMRSGRSDSKERVRELLMFGALKSMEGETKRGFKDGIFRTAIISSLDSISKPGENESTSLNQIKIAVNELFENKEFITIEVKKNDKLEVIKVARPLIFNAPISAIARLPKSISNAKSFNQDGAKSMLNMYITENMPNQKTLNSDQEYRDFITKELANQRQRPERDEEVINLLEYVEYTLTPGSRINRNSIASNETSDAFQMQTRALIYLNVVAAVQCKSGKDRTPTLVAGTVAESYLSSITASDRSSRNLILNQVFKSISMSTARISFGPKAKLKTSGHQRPSKVLPPNQTPKARS